MIVSATSVTESAISLIFKVFARRWILKFEPEVARVGCDVGKKFLAKRTRYFL